MKKETLQQLRQLVFELYDRAARLMGIFCADQIETERLEEELKKMRTGSYISLA